MDGCRTLAGPNRSGGGGCRFQMRSRAPPRRSSCATTPLPSRSRKSPIAVGPKLAGALRAVRSVNSTSSKGAAPTTAMTHLAIQEQLDGKAVDWMEKVSDEQYQG